MPRDLPSGDVTFLFTDVEGSTRLLHELGEERLLARRTEREAVFSSSLPDADRLVTGGLE